MKNTVIQDNETRECLDTMMAMALIRGLYRKDIISKEILVRTEKKYKKILKNTNICANMGVGTNVGKD